MGTFNPAMNAAINSQETASGLESGADGTLPPAGASKVSRPDIPPPLANDAPAANMEVV